MGLKCLPRRKGAANHTPKLPCQTHQFFPKFSTRDTCLPPLSLSTSVNTSTGFRKADPERSSLPLQQTSNTQQHRPRGLALLQTQALCGTGPICPRLRKCRTTHKTKCFKRSALSPPDDALACILLHSSTATCHSATTLPHRKSVGYCRNKRTTQDARRQGCHIQQAMGELVANLPETAATYPKQATTKPNRTTGREPI